MRRREKNRALHRRLEDWGEWTDVIPTGLGYRSCTTESVMMEMGEMCRSGNTAVAVVPHFRMNRECASVDTGILALCNKEQESALRSMYQFRIKAADVRTYCTKIGGDYNKVMAEYAKRLTEGEKLLAEWLGYEYES